MPSRSKSQQQAAGAAYAKKCKGKDVNLTGASKQMAKDMSCETLKHYADTNRKKLPEKKNKKK